jgi:hypothetical protein
MANASSQPFGNLLASKFQGFTPGNYSNAFKTNLDSTLASPVTPETTPGVANSLFNSAGLDVIKGETNPNLQALMYMEMMKRRTAEEDRKNFPGAIKDLYDLQYEARLKARPLEFQELVAKKFLNNLTEIPQNIIKARRITQDMYAPPQAGNVQLVNYGASSPRRIF